MKTTLNQNRYEVESILVKNDNHIESTKLLFNHIKNLKIKGVIHVGAHLGEEVNFYKSNGAKEIILFEANPVLVKKLSSIYQYDHSIKIFNYAVSNQNSEIDFYVHKSNSGIESSSIFKMSKLDKIVKSLKTTETFKVQSITLDECIKKHAIDISNYNVLVCDIQGADYYAISGFSNYINKMDAVIVEVQFLELYENYASEDRFDEFMTEMGFKKEFLISHELYVDDNYFPGWGEVLYVREDSVL